MKILLKRLLPILFAALVSPAQAAMVSTRDIAPPQAQSAPDTGQAAAARLQLREQLIEAGVSPAQAAERVERLTDAQVAAVQGEIDSLPAGAGMSTTTLLLLIIIIILLV